MASNESRSVWLLEEDVAVGKRKRLKNTRALMQIVMVVNVKGLQIYVVTLYIKQRGSRGAAKHASLIGPQFWSSIELELGS